MFSSDTRLNAEEVYILLLHTNRRYADGISNGKRGGMQGYGRSRDLELCKLQVYAERTNIQKLSSQRMTLPIPLRTSELAASG